MGNILESVGSGLQTAGGVAQEAVFPRVPYPQKKDPTTGELNTSPKFDSEGNQEMYRPTPSFEAVQKFYAMILHAFAMTDVTVPGSAVGLPAAATRDASVVH